jgi:hypothetical protein
MTVFPITGSPWQVESAPGINGLIRLNATARDTYILTSAGILAVLNQIYTYLNTGTPKNAATILRLASSQAGVAVEVDVSSFSFPVLTGDIAAQVAALAVIFQTAANVAT